MTDKERLDWLDEQRQPVTDSSNTELLAYAWAVQGQHHDIRSLIDEAMKSEL